MTSCSGSPMRKISFRTRVLEELQVSGGFRLGPGYKASHHAVGRRPRTLQVRYLQRPGRPLPCHVSLRSRQGSSVDHGPQLQTNRRGSRGQDHRSLRLSLLLSIDPNRRSSRTEPNRRHRNGASSGYRHPGAEDSGLRTTGPWWRTGCSGLASCCPR